MRTAVPDILARIVARKRVELRRTEEVREALQLRADETTPRRRDFAAVLLREGPAIIAEIKKASPSKGVLAEDFHPERIARAYERGGAAALSVLTDERFFQGSLDHLRAARATVNLPALRKDFTIDPLQVIEAAAAGADAILLIAAVLTERELRDMRELAARYRMAALVEVHDADELQAAIDSGAAIVGVNNRDLRTFEVRLETSIRLAGLMPANVTKVAESGIHSREDIVRLRAAGFQGFLVGEHLMKSGDPEAAVRELLACW